MSKISDFLLAVS